MLLYKLNLNPFFAPVTADTGAIEDKALSKEETIDFLSEDTEEPEVIELEKGTKKSSKGADEGDKEDKETPAEEDKSLEDEIEEELSEPDEDKLELTTPVRRKEILAKYPDIFKDFPDLEKAYYRERAFTEIIPTIEDAKVAVEKSERLDMYENEIMGGSTESLLTAVLNTDKDSFNRVVDNYLPTLFKVNEAAYYHTIGNVVKHTIMSMVRDGKDNDVPDLIAAADIVNQYLFGTKQFSPPQKLLPDDKAKQPNEVDEREQKFVERQFNTAKDALSTKTENILKATIDKNIDPNESMSSYVKKNATREAYESLDKAIDADSRFTAVMDKLWEKAFNDDFSTESMDRIKSAYLSKAKTLLPAIIKKSRNEALKGLGKRVRDNDDEDTNKKDKRGPLPVGKARSNTASPQSGKAAVKDAAKAIPKGMSTLDYLMQD